MATNVATRDCDPLRMEAIGLHPRARRQAHPPCPIVLLSGMTNPRHLAMRSISQHRA